MKSEIIKKESKTINFPKLMESIADEAVVLFTSESTGTVVHVGRWKDNYMAEFSDNWGSNFKDFTGKIILSN